ncbi:MAG: hypothetical protein HQ546_10830, partial [Planctomycetes bacterium]|nr:hypothetical protein [Planctomycetota bacterium]
LHPDQCPKLRLPGVDFAIPPRGLQIRPTFDEPGKAKLDVGGVDDWPEIENLLRRAGRSVKGDMLALDIDASAGLLCDLMALARKALLRQYDLTDGQVAELLAFGTDERPEYINQLLRWAQGLPMEYDPFDASSYQASLLNDFHDVDTPEPNRMPAKPWWKFW